MEHFYTHHHVRHAHHTGIIIGAIAGSCAVTFAAAITLIAVSPSLILHPLSFTTHISIKQDSSQPVQAGAAGQLGSSESLVPRQAGASQVFSQVLSQR